MKHIVSFSGGIGSFMAAKRVVEEHEKENVLLVFTDTKIEDEDLYRFMDDAIAHLDVEFLKIEDGRDVWQVFFDEKYIGNTRNGNCTRNLKQKVFREWLENNYKPDECIVYLGFDWMEPHRLEKAKPHWEPYQMDAPMVHEPYLSKEDMFKVLKEAGIKKPRLYEMGFSHNNCGGFCVKAGHGHFKQLLSLMPERYGYHEQKESEWQKTFGKPNTILKDRRGGKTKPMTLKQFRERVGKEDTQLELDDFGGCGCFSEDY